TPIGPVATGTWQEAASLQDTERRVRVEIVELATIQPVYLPMVVLGRQ
ncbi:MAG: hypothetical protein HC837_20450, partial [Chloroflexaceae bacterium]|nr:hypothetical protein [Chloroflexaceae bacterium]